MARPGRFTIPTAAVLHVLTTDPTDDRMWCASEVAEGSGLSYGSAYAILQRLYTRGLVARVHIDGGIGHTRVWYELTDVGSIRADQILKVVPDPIAALSLWLIDNPDDQFE